MDVLTLKPFPKEVVRRLIEPFEHILVVDEHVRTAGLYSNLCELVAENAMVKRLGAVTLPHEFPMGSASRDRAHEAFGMKSLVPRTKIGL